MLLLLNCYTSISFIGDIIEGSPLIVYSYLGVAVAIIANQIFTTTGKYYTFN